MAAPKGHPRWGGKPKGHKSAARLSKEALHARIQALVSAEVDAMTLAQIAQAKGLSYLVVRQKDTGKIVRLAEHGAKLKLADDEAVVEVWSKDPSTPAYTDLINRADGKPIERHELSGPDGGPIPQVIHEHVPA